MTRFGAVPREIFVPHARQSLAYVDDIHWFGLPRNSRFMLVPVTLAKLLYLADIAPTDAVLDVGCGTGYATAIIAGLAATATGLEEDVALAGLAQANLQALSLNNATAVSGSVAQFGENRFDLIIVQGLLDSVPEHYFSALNEGGRLVAIVRQGPVGLAHLFRKSNDKVTSRAEFSASLPPLFASSRDDAFVF